MSNDALSGHDHKCVALNKILTSPVICTYCQVIRSVRSEYEEYFEVDGHPV